MPQSWVKALNQYSYPVQLREFSAVRQCPGFFQKDIKGDRDSTIDFENHFRSNATNIEAWYEVVYWKLFSQKRALDGITLRVIQNLTDAKVNAEKIKTAARVFMSSESENDFDAYRRLFHFSTDVIAIVATFPAFLDPERFPMVDTRVAKWVNLNYQKFNAADPDGPCLIQSEYGRTSLNATLTMRDFRFYLHWIHWTRHMARKLTKATGQSWRARDVEMAVFTAWGNWGQMHPGIILNPLSKYSEPSNTCLNQQGITR